MKNMLLRAIQHKEKMELIYLDKNNLASQRVVQVYKINDDKIMAYCYTKRAIRTFKLDNILSVGPVRKRMGA
ncbi:hypothetical protein CFK37_19180 [Virgibacillus phasianinus]|uniref:WYL domain-containing protein n=1 Tax=Virgibacillus phasianinus TaxID=2017483 RepID=A0A220U8R1_9BACI|nr:WYL domain-containing protein [Virgibacillus phasianinus]ASK64123.1 hypothetical protein CFK37_19180 [Virgibacillus phasianinus]